MRLLLEIHISRDGPNRNVLPIIGRNGRSEENAAGRLSARRLTKMPIQPMIFCGQYFSWQNTSELLTTSGKR